MKLRVRAVVAGLMVAAGGTVASGTTAAAASERMQLECTSGSLAGHTLERSNGSSWWDVEDGTVYTTKSITVSGDEGVVFQHDYGKKAKESETCTGTHFEWTWDLELMRAGG